MVDCQVVVTTRLEGNDSSLGIWLNQSKDTQFESGMHTSKIMDPNILVLDAYD
jgi:hypothetical protein